MTILKRLDLYWFKANPSIKEKLQVFDAIIKSKLLYGLESAPMNEYTKHELDIFQLKGIGKILGIKTTFIDRTQDTTKIYKQVQICTKKIVPPHPSLGPAGRGIGRAAGPGVQFFWYIFVFCLYCFIFL